MKPGRIIFLVLLFALLGYCREFFFVHLNTILYKKYYHHAAVQIPLLMQPFEKFSYTALYYSKYLYTLLWTALFFAANRFALKDYANGKNLRRILTYSYILLLFLAAVSMAWGYFINGRLQDDEYTLSRWLMGIAQSPILCLILMASEKLYSKSLQP